jgi:maleate isomerase
LRAIAQQQFLIREDSMKQLSSRAATGGAGRRSFLRGAACAGLCAATAPALGLLAAPARASNWRGFVGCVKPRANDPVLAEMIRLLPVGIGVGVTYLNLTEGSKEEMQRSFDNYEKNIAYLASQKCDTISIEGAPPFMILGPDGEARLVDGWKDKYKTDMFTSSQNQVNVLRAMKIKKIFGVAAFGQELNRAFAKYFEDSGISVADMATIDVSFKGIPDLPPEMLYGLIKKTFLSHKGSDAIYILGSGLDTLSIIEALEQDLGVPVVQPTAARVWEIQKRLHVRQPVKGYGTLLATMPV